MLFHLPERRSLLESDPGAHHLPASAIDLLRNLYASAGSLCRVYFPMNLPKVGAVIQSWSGFRYVPLIATLDLRNDVSVQKFRYHMRGYRLKQDDAMQ